MLAFLNRHCIEEGLLPTVTYIRVTGKLHFSARQVFRDLHLVYTKMRRSREKPLHL